MKHLSIVIPTLSGGGAERVAVNLANQYADDGHSVDLVVFEKRGPFVDILDERIHLVDLNVVNKWKTVFLLTRYLRSTKPDCVLAVMRYTNIVVSLAAWLAGVRSVLNEQNTLQAFHILGWNKRVIYRSVMRFTYHRATHLIANSTDTRDALVSENILSSEKISVLGNPVLPEDWNAEKHDPPHPWMSDPALQVVLGVGRLHYQKNFPFLIDSFERVHQQNTRSRLLIVGEGDLREKLQTQVSAKGLTDVVQILPFQNNIVAYYAHADVFALSSRWEGFGNVIVEALACGIPVVSVNCPGGPKMILNDSAYGTLVPVDDESAFGDAILAQLSQPKEEGQSTRIQRANDFSIENVAAQFLEIMTA